MYLKKCFRSHSTFKVNGKRQTLWILFNCFLITFYVSSMFIPHWKIRHQLKLGIFTFFYVNYISRHLCNNFVFCFVLRRPHDFAKIDSFWLFVHSSLCKLSELAFISALTSLVQKYCVTLNIVNPQFASAMATL